MGIRIRLSSPPTCKQTNKGMWKIFLAFAALQWGAVDVGGMCGAGVAPAFLLIAAKFTFIPRAASISGKT